MLNQRPTPPSTPSWRLRMRFLFGAANLRDRLLFHVSFWLPRRLMYFAINRAIIDGRNVYGDKWLFTLHKLDNVRSEYGGIGRFGRKARVPSTKATKP